MTTQGKRNNPYYQAQAILARRDHSEAEMRQKLQRKQFSSTQVNEVLAWLKQEKLIDDAKFAQVYTDSILRSKAVGPRWIDNKLRQRGVAEVHRTHVQEEFFSPDQEKEIAQQALTTWQARRPGAPWDKAARFLGSRGFSPSVIHQVLDGYRSTE